MTDSNNHNQQPTTNNQQPTTNNQQLNNSKNHQDENVSLNRFLLPKLSFSLFLSEQLSRVKKIINNWRKRQLARQLHKIVERRLWEKERIKQFHEQRKERMLDIESEQNTNIDTYLEKCTKMLDNFKQSKNKQYDSYIINQIQLDPLMKEKIKKTKRISDDLYIEKLQSIIDSLTELKNIQLEEKAPKASVKIFDKNDESMTLKDDSMLRPQNEEIKSILFRPGNAKRKKPTAPNNKKPRFHD
jgi:hypothetical protein